jgi:multidrug resistance efflux pump
MSSNVGVNASSVVDANSFWVDRYFEETNLAPVWATPVQIDLMIKCVSRPHPRQQARSTSGA